MISSAHGFIFLHYPKTGGTSLQSVLLPYSDDKKSIKNHQDGVQRFEVVGAITPKKHATLQDYWDRLGDGISNFKLAMSVRHPFERIISAYFSPHKWRKRNLFGKWVEVQPVWDAKRFDELLCNGSQRPAVDFLTVNGVITKPDFIIRRESIRSDFENFLRLVNIPAEAATSLPHVNANSAPDSLKQSLLANTSLRDRVEDLYRADMEYFGYETYQPR